MMPEVSYVYSKTDLKSDFDHGMVACWWGRIVDGAGNVVYTVDSPP